MRTISIAEISFFDAFGRDTDFHDLYPQAAYLDIATGGVIWIFKEDQDAEHHEILQEFLKSNWTNDGELWKRAFDVYSGSIGQWIDAVGDRNVVHSYYNFRDSKIKEMAEEFLQEHGIKPLWR